MLFMVIEKFRGGDAVPVYRRFRDQGRTAPDGLSYVDSWVDEGLIQCFQLMECEDERLLQEWIGRWEDLVEFEVIEVIPSRVAAERIRPRL
ncbi:MAG: DUF3303 domain-containing protein [Gemmatimonadetes bacterium]|nr:DUF3303 domain-containing protein [Gemmatimonadota bacterium]